VKTEKLSFLSERKEAAQMWFLKVTVENSLQDKHNEDEKLN
jgi:hypothetical protein